MRNFAHRGLWHKPEEGNSLAAIERALVAGFDVETDVRILDKQFVVKHDKPNASEKLPLLTQLLDVLEKYPDRQMALHAKYKDWADPYFMEICSMLAPVANQIFLFDMSLECCMALKSRNNKIRVGVSVGDKKYHDAFCDLVDALNSEVDLIWADEYRRLYSKDFIKTCQQHGKAIYCISPDIAGMVGHPLAQDGYQQTWQSLIDWGVDGICTDHSMELAALLGERQPA